MEYSDVTFILDAVVLFSFLICVVSMIWFNRRSLPVQNSKNTDEDVKDCKNESQLQSECGQKPLTVDPHHIPGHLKRTQHKIIENQIKSQMTEEDVEREMRIQQEQIEAIKRLLEKDSSLFGEGSLDEMNEQLRLYGL